MEYIGSVNKKTLEVELRQVIDDNDWVDIPKGTTTITVYDEDTVYFWDNKNGLNFEDGGWHTPSDLGHCSCRDYLANVVCSVIEIDTLKHELENKKEAVSLKATKSDGEMFNPLDVQAGGGHYKKRGIQPVEYGLTNNLSFPQVNVVKYITRHEDKNGIEDLSKSIHYHFIEALRCYGVEGSTKLKKLVLEMLGEEK